MKTLALLALLSTLVSCIEGNGSGGNSGGGPVKERYQNAFSTLARGQSALTKTRGETRSWDYETTTMTSEPVSTEESSVVLKIEGTNVYSYEVETDKTDGTTERKVSLESYDASQMDEVLKLPGTAIVGDRLVFSTTIDSEWTLSTATVNSKHAFNVSINLAKPLCEMFASISSTGTISRTDGTTTTLPVVTSDSVQTCGRILSSEELIAIDLTSVMFCDETQMDDENYECESERDMSFLTADL